MNSKKLSRSNVKKGTSKKPVVKECYGARIERQSKVKSLSAASVRTKSLKTRHTKEPPRPVRKYDLGNAIYLMVQKVDWHNGQIVGYEWGGDNKFFSKNEWLYYVKQLDSSEGPWIILGESEIHGRISL